MISSHRFLCLSYLHYLCLNSFHEFRKLQENRFCLFSVLALPSKLFKVESKIFVAIIHIKSTFCKTVIPALSSGQHKLHPPIWGGHHQLDEGSPAPPKRMNFWKNFKQPLTLPLYLIFGETIAFFWRNLKVSVASI